MDIKELFSSNSFDILDKIYNELAEDLSYITIDDKKQLETTNEELNKQLEILRGIMRKFKKDDEQRFINTLIEFINNRDYIGAYYNQKYFKERSKNWDKINRRSNKIRLKASINVKKHLLFPWKNRYI